MAKKSKPTKTAKPVTEGLAEQAELDIASAMAYMQGTYTSKWTQFWQLYRGERVKIGYHSQSGVDSFDPQTYNNVETNVANVFGSKPRVVYLPTKLEQQKETRVLNQMFDYTWDRNDISLEIIPAGRELFITGNFTFWDTWEDDWIKSKRVSIRDCIFDPNASSKETMRFGGYRYLTSLDALKEVKHYDADADDWMGKYKDLDKIQVWTNGVNEDLDRQLKDCYEGSTLDGEAKKNQVEISLLYYVKGPHKGKMVEMANRSVCIYESDSPFQKKAEKRSVHVAQYAQDGTPTLDENKKPVFKKQEMEIPAIEPFIPCWFQRNIIDGSLLFGMGEVEPNLDQQELLNDTITQKRDNVTANINNMTFIDPKFKDMITKVKNIPNSVYAIPPDAVKFAEKPDMTAAADVEITRLKESMRTTAAIDEVTAGLAPDHQSTATQINQQINQGGMRFKLKLQSLENEGFKQAADNWYKMFRIFVTEEQIIRITGRKGVEWLKLNPDYFWGNYESKVTLDQNAKAQRDDEIKRIESISNILMNNPYVDQKELTRIITTRLLEFDDDEADTIMVKDDDLVAKPPAAGQVQPGMAPGGPQMPGVPNMPNGQLPANPAAMAAIAKALGDAQPGNQGPKTIQERIIETIDYADLPEDAKKEVLSQQLGIESNMASPTQQDFNLKAMQLQHDQTKHDLTKAQADHKALLDTHGALLKEHQALLSHQNQEFTQGQQVEQAKREAKRPAEPNKAAA